MGSFIFLKEVKAVKTSYKYRAIIGISLILMMGSFAFASVPSSPKVISLGGSITADTGKCMGDNLARNPATLANANKGIMFNYNKPFGIEGHGSNGLSLSWSGQKFGFAAIINKTETLLPEQRHGQINNNSYSEKDFGFGIARKINSSLNLGMGLWLNSIDVSILDDAEGIDRLRRDTYIDLGLTYGADLWNFGVAIKSLPLTKSNSIRNKEYKAGLRIGKADLLSFIVDFGMSESSLGENIANIQGGIEGWIQPDFAFRIGFNEQKMLTFGFGLEKGGWQFDYAYSPHILGNSHFLETGYMF